jgi:phage shock protein PspC (stress-responsive transcriptional regulator)
MAIHRLTRSRADGKIAGVCAGIANYFDVDVALVRVSWVVLSIVPGAIVGGVLAYLAAWLLMPEGAEPVAVPRGRRLTRSAIDRQLAGVCGGLAEYFGVDATPIRLLWVVLSILCGAIVGGVIAYLIAWLIIPRAPDVVLSAPAAASPTV